jgi:hypothetical protein
MIEAVRRFLAVFLSGIPGEDEQKNSGAVERYLCFRRIDRRSTVFIGCETSL